VRVRILKSLKLLELLISPKLLKSSKLLKL